MGLTNMTKTRSILLIGKTGTGKTTKSLTFVTKPVVLYANDIDFDIGSFPSENGIIIEDLHYKADKSAILNILRNYTGQVVLTANTKKSVPKEIVDMCVVKKAGHTNYLADLLKIEAPNSEPPLSFERDTYSLVADFLKEKDRDLMARLLLFNKPSDTQVLSWLVGNMHPNRLIFVDGVVKRRWSQKYFYEMLAYSHTGNSFGQINMPKRQAYSQIPRLSRRLGVKNPKLLDQLFKDEEFMEWSKKKLNNGECRLLKIGEKKKGRKKKTDPITVQQTNLEEFYGKTQ
tara:strand:- start:180 stop:1040 length:861 start_codon:yes stop_codon:yes gene_type:complete